MDSNLNWISLNAFENGQNYEIYNEYPFMIRNAKTKRILLGKKRHDGYREYTFCKNGIRKYYAHHILIYKTFVHYYDDPKLQIDHRNGIRDDNRLNNLKLCYQSDNMINTHTINGIKRRTYYDEENMVLVQDDIYYHKRHDVFCRETNDGYKYLKEFKKDNSYWIKYKTNRKQYHINTTKWKEAHYYLF